MQQSPVYVSFFLNGSRPNADGTCLIKMNVYQKPHKRRYSTNFHVSKEEWEKLNAPKLRDEKLKELEKKLSILKTNAEKIIEKIIPFSFVAFKELFFDEPAKSIINNPEIKTGAIKSKMLCDWFKNIISVLDANDQVGTASIYKSTINSINEFKKNSLYITSLADFYFLSKFNSRVKKSVTTIGIYMRHLRAIINDAIEAKVISRDSYSFKNHQIPSGQNVKKALKNFYINRILTYQPKKIDHQKAIDYWIFPYLCNAMNFADIIT